MDNLWTPGSKKPQTRVKGTEDLDDLLGDLLVDDVAPKKKAPSKPIGGVRPGTKKQGPNISPPQGSKDEDFYSNLAATAEDDLSDVSEADVNQMAKSIADLEDMDADLFGGKFKKKGSVKGASDRSSKPNTPRRTGTPRSRSTTPRAASPQTRVTSPTARVTSPISKVSVSPTPEPSGTPRGNSQKKTAAKSGISVNMTAIPDHKPGSAPGKMTDIGSASENLKPGGMHTPDRPGTVPKTKPKYDYSEMDMDDLLAAMTDEEEDSLAGKSKKKTNKQKVDMTVKKDKSIDDIAPYKPSEPEESRKRNLFERPPTRSGGNTEPDEPIKRASSPVKKKDEGGIFSDDDDFLGGLGIEEKGAPAPKVKVMEEEDTPARSVMDKLLAKDSVSKHLQPKKERREFVLDKKYTQPNDVAEEEEDFQFGEYQPSVVSTGSRPTSKRSVRFQDEDDIFGFDRPPSRGRSPASIKKPDDMDWLNDIATAVKSAPSAKDSSSKPSTSESKPISQPETKTSDSTPKSETKQSDNANESKKTEVKPPTSKSKSSAADWLGLDDADDEDDEPLTWMRAKSQQKETSSPSAADKRNEWISGRKSESQPVVQKAEPKGSPADWLGLSSSKDDDNDYLGLGKEVDPASLLKVDSPVFGGKGKVDDKDLFKPPSLDSGLSPTPWQSAGRKPQQPNNEHPNMQPSSTPKVESPANNKPVPTFRSDVFETSGLREEVQSESDTRASTDFFSFGKSDKQQDMSSSQAIQIQQQQQQQQQSLLAQQAQLEDMMKNLQSQYELATKFQVPPPPVFTPDNRSSVMANPPRSIMDAQTRLYKMEIERDYAYALLEMNKRRFDEEKQTIENSYKSRMELIEETNKNKETRLKDDNEHLMNQYLSKVRQLESDKSDLSSHYQRRIEELQRDKDQEIERLKLIHRNSLDDLKRDHEDAMERLKKAKDQQIEAAITSHDTTKSLVQAVSMIQNNAKDLGELQKKVDGWHNMGLDEREIAIRSKDEQLKILQERLNRQQEENDMERKRLEDLISRLETQLREQTRMLDEERWKVKQEQTRLQSLQSSLEEERRLWTEQQVRERSNIEKTRETLLEEQKSVLSQLHKERQSVAEERTKLNVAKQVQQEDVEDTAVKLAQAKAEFEALMKSISEEKNKANIRRQELQHEEDKLQEDRRKLLVDQSKMGDKEEDLIRAAETLKERSEEVDQLFVESQSKLEEGRNALLEAKKIESDENQRSANIQHQIQMLRLKEKEIAEERLRLSKDKKEVENLKSAMLCPNCRTPGGTLSKAQNVDPNPQYQQHNGIQQMPRNNPAVQQSLNSVGSITESIKADRSIRMWKMEAMKDQKYLEEQSMFLYTLKHMPYSSSTPKS